MLVQPGVDPDILGSHLLLGKLLHLLDGSGSPVLEPDAMQPLVQVDGVLTGDNLAHCRALGLLLALRHGDLSARNKGQPDH